MKNIIPMMLLVLFAVLVGNAHATENAYYAGAKFGQMLVDANGYDDATNLGLLAGMDIMEFGLGDVSIEAEFTFAASDGDTDAFGANGNWDALTLAAYGVFRSKGNYYVKGKAGLLYEDISVETGSSAGTISEDDYGFSAGVGGGYRFSERINCELEYTVIEDELDFLSMGINYLF